MTGYKIYGNKYKYIEFEYTDLGYNIYQFYTIINGKGYNFTVQKVNPINEEDKTLIKGMIDTVSFKIDEHFERPIGEEGGSSIKDSAIRGGIIGAIVGLVGAIAAKKKKGKKQETTNTDQNVNNNQPNDPNNQNNNNIMM